MFSAERIIVRRKNQEEISEGSLDNVSFSSNNSFYENLDIETKRNIIFLIKSGYDKKTIIKLYIFFKPSNISEAVHYLTKENGIYQHIFYNSSNKEDICEVCGEKKIMHINTISRTASISNNSINIISLRQEEEKNEKFDIITINNKNTCKICEEEITKEEIKNKCEKCNNYFCSECLYLNIKELIINGKCSLFCPECKFVYTKDKIEQILLFNIKDKEEINKLKSILEKNNTKQMILSNPELMFCPIVNCEGYAKKNNNKEYNICTKGHKFCIKCGELWHKEGKCKEGENVDELFQIYRKKYHLKNCPYCNIVTYKTGGCNHMNCKFCNKHWCWLCQKLFTSTEEHYGNINSKCYNKVQTNLDILICDKCENEIFDNNSFKTFFKCGHCFCYDCFKKHFIENINMITFPQRLNCIKLGCNGYQLFSYNYIIDFIEKSNDDELIKKYKNSIIFREYALHPLFDYIKYYSIYEKIIGKIKRSYPGFSEKLDCFLGVVGIILVYLFYPIFVILVPIFFHYTIKYLYYFKFLPEIKKQYNNRVIIFCIIAGQEILSLVFLFSLIALHYILHIFYISIAYFIFLIRNLCCEEET